MRVSVHSNVVLTAGKTHDEMDAWYSWGKESALPPCPEGKWVKPAFSIIVLMQNVKDT
jgi:hypothetical protein